MRWNPLRVDASDSDLDYRPDGSPVPVFPDKKGSVQKKETDPQRKIYVEDVLLVSSAFGSKDRNVEKVCDAFDVKVVLHNDHIVISGQESARAESALLDLIWAAEQGDLLDEQRVDYIITQNRSGHRLRENGSLNEIICFTYQGKPVRARTFGQQKYIDQIRNHEIVFGIGPAGTGKTYLAVAMAMRAYKNKEVEKIILARPAVEAGENLGFLPGDLQEKVDPYLRPLYDALFDLFGKEQALRLKEKEIIEVVPLAYMRGRTLDRSFIILDEAQNTTREQMKMFLTRLGFGSRAVITGDVTQIDLPKKSRSGLKDAARILQDVEGIAFSYLKDDDVVRHPLVKRVIAAYARDAERRAKEE